MDDKYLIVSIVGGLILLVVLYFFFRYVFSVDKQLKNQERIIRMLILSSKKQGASNEEINEAVR